MKCQRCNKEFDVIDEAGPRGGVEYYRDSEVGLCPFCGEKRT